MLSLKKPKFLRQELAQYFSRHSTEQLSWLLGQQASSPSVAFFIGYQAAVRCLDSKLEPNKWAAVAISETGVKSPFECQTQYLDGRLIGQKSHVMLASGELDVAYVLARCGLTEPRELILFKLDSSLLIVEGQVAQPVMAEVAHFRVRFDVPIKEQYFCNDAHNKVNKPFRYWEDVHVLLALAGWLQSKLPFSQSLNDAVVQLQSEFLKDKRYYTLASMDALETLLNLLMSLALSLDEESLAQWNKDSMLFHFMQPVREKIKAKLSASC